MSFTQDELQALHTILDQKMVALLRELERFFDRRMQILRNEFEQHQQRLQDSIESAFAAQLPVIEQLINQRFPASGRDKPQSSPVPVMYTDQPQTNFEAIEVQTEIPWEDLIDLLNRALNERFVAFNTFLQARLQDIEHEVSSQIQLLRDDLRKQQPVASFSDIPSGQGPVGSGLALGSAHTEAEMQDILTSVYQLEQIVESMQVAMAANSTLISKRFSYHQRLPVEQAHPSRSFSSTESEHSTQRDIP